MPRLPILKTSKMSIFSCENGNKYVFIDKIIVGGHSESPEYVEDRTIKRRERAKKKIG